MNLYSQWKKLMDGQTNATFQAFWNKYSDTEIQIYSSILAEPDSTFSGVFKDLATAWNAESVYFMGFLDGVAASLNSEIDLESITEDSVITLDIDLEKLYFNMRAAKAKHLYELPHWDSLLSVEKRDEITKEQRRAGTVLKEKTPGRNEPCSCGSGKKYKKCCGAGIIS